MMLLHPDRVGQGTAFELHRREAFLILILILIVIRLLISRCRRGPKLTITIKMRIKIRKQQRPAGLIA